MVASCHCQYLLPSSACGLHPSWGVLESLYFLGFPPLFSKPSTYRSPCDWHIVGAYDLVNGWGQKDDVVAERGARGFSSDPENQARDWVRHPMATLTTLVQHPSPGSFGY